MSIPPNEALNTQKNKIKNLWQNLLKSSDTRSECFTILLPPPNITGSLHIGHFLNWSLQDLLMRHAYAKGLQPKWITGIDHAGISTQFVVERELKKENKTRIEIGRAAFEKRIFEWKEKSEDLITNQALTFGFFFNWEKRRFTMDNAYQKEVIAAFVKLYNAGLIKKSERITNWDPIFQTAISDLEVLEKIEKRKMYIIRYDCTDETNSICIGTTRPETLFADAAIAVHPDDERYKHLIGKTFKIPLTDKIIPLIADSVIEQDKGTGALKVTPAQDMKDYEIGLRNNLEYIQVVDKAGCLYNVPEKFKGIRTLEARDIVAHALEEIGNLVEIRDWEGICYYTEKSDIPIETIITDQWFLDVQKMAEESLHTTVQFIPENIRSTYNYWLNNIKPWCISRQIWWGHRIPIWYKEDGTAICAHDQAEAEAIAGTKNLQQETDVLDTWFSSALWPIATQEKFVPTDVLITGRDILFFWVARMIMFTHFFKKEIPFKAVYFNGIVRDAQRQKMSKTKGNVMDPLELAETYGNDGLRFALLRQASWGKDIALKINDLEDGRAFCTKISNATKFLTQFMKTDYNPNALLDNWMETKIAQAQEKIAQAIENFAFHEACSEFYDIFWNNFCAWYIEGMKIAPSLKAKEFFCAILKIGHPIIPWASEEAFQEITNSEKACLDYEISFKISNQNTNTEKNAEKFDKIITITKLLRKLGATANLKHFYAADQAIAEFIKFYTKLNLDENICDFKITTQEIEIAIPFEQAKTAAQVMQKEFDSLSSEITSLNAKIRSAQNVPENILDEWNTRFDDLKNNYNSLQSWLAQMEILK